MMVHCLKGLENTKIPNDDVGNGNYDDSDDDDDDLFFMAYGCACVGPTVHGLYL